MFKKSLLALVLALVFVFSLPLKSWSKDASILNQCKITIMGTSYAGDMLEFVSYYSKVRLAGGEMRSMESMCGEGGAVSVQDEFKIECTLDFKCDSNVQFKFKFVSITDLHGLMVTEPEEGWINLKDESRIVDLGDITMSDTMYH